MNFISRRIGTSLIALNLIIPYFHIASGLKTIFSSVQSLSHWVRLCDPMNSSTPGFPVHHKLPEFTQTHIHWVSDAIQPSHPLSSPSPPAPNPSQHQCFPMSQLFTWGGQSTGVSASASFLPKKSQGWSPSKWTGWISLQSKGLSRVFSNSTVQKHQFFGTQPSSHPTLTSIHDHRKNNLTSIQIQCNEASSLNVYQQIWHCMQIEVRLG